MKPLPRTEFGNPILRKKAKKVSHAFLRTRAFKTLVKNMIYTMRRVEGVGLAAPQIGKSLALVVMELHPTKTRPNLKRYGPIVVVNPRIISSSKEKESDFEGCLSFERVRARVPRARRVVVEYINETGEKVRERATGLWARIFQHEIDHLCGRVYMDRVTDMKTLMTEDEFAKRVLRR